MNIIEILVTIAGVMMSVGYYPQAYTIWKKRSSKNVSKVSYWIFGICTTIWMFYGLYLNNWTIFWSFIFGVIGSWLVLALTYHYGRNIKR
jgi:uncharacterized protein with PQ loop repeat